jgi:hypothetical protein
VLPGRKRRLDANYDDLNSVADLVTARTQAVTGNHFAALVFDATYARNAAPWSSSE